MVWLERVPACTGGKAGKHPAHVALCLIFILLYKEINHVFAFELLQSSIKPSYKVHKLLSEVV